MKLWNEQFKPNISGARAAIIQKVTPENMKNKVGMIAVGIPNSQFPNHKF